MDTSIEYKHLTRMITNCIICLMPISILYTNLEYCTYINFNIFLVSRILEQLCVQSLLKQTFYVFILLIEFRRIYI